MDGDDGSGPWSVSSPSRILSLVVELKESSGPGSGTNGLCCRVRDNNGEVLPSAPLGITLKGLGRFTGNLRFVGTSIRIIDEHYSMPVGKRSQCINKANELTLDFLNDTDAKMSLILRAYDDGIAYR
jgi:alpha-glucosidase